jgi:hypothetical protein
MRGDTCHDPTPEPWPAILALARPHRHRWPSAVISRISYESLSSNYLA